jgi:hypothetical protein
VDGSRVLKFSFGEHVTNHGSSGVFSMTYRVTSRAVVPYLPNTEK